MNNLQLKELFDSILSLPTSFDRILKLQQIKKQYRASDFFKQTHMPIYKAYELFIKDSIATELMLIKRFANADYVGEYITDTLDHIAPDTIQDFAERIVDAFNTNELLAASAEIGAQLKKLQR